MTLCIWVTFRNAAHADGKPVLRCDAIVAARAQLTELAQADPSTTGATLVLDTGEEIVLDLAMPAGRA